MTQLIKISSKSETIKENRRLGTKYQQNMIEMISYIYLEPNKYNVYSLAKEMNKSERTILRMIKDINDFCPIIRSNFYEAEDFAYRHIDEYISESYLDKCYKISSNSPMLYLFLIMLLNRELTASEIMNKINLKNRAQVQKFMDNILDASSIIDCNFKEEDIVFGNWKFIY